MTMSLAEDSLSKADQNKTILTPVHSDKVKSVMRRLKLLFYEREYTDLEQQDLTEKQIELLVEETKALVGTAAHSSSFLNLKDEDQLTFNAMANQLHNLTQELKSKLHHQADLIPTYIKMQDTCNTCHRIFRDH
jgi:hypothetical protein